MTGLAFYVKLCFFKMFQVTVRPSSPLPSFTILSPPHHTSHFIFSTKTPLVIAPSDFPPLNPLQPCEPQVFYEANKLACPYSLESEPAELANYICIALLIEVSNSNLILPP